MSNQKESCWTPACSKDELFAFIIKSNSLHAIDFKIEATLAIDPSPAWVEELYSDLTAIQSKVSLDEIKLRIHELAGNEEEAEKLRQWLAGSARRKAAAEQFIENIVKS